MLVTNGDFDSADIFQRWYFGDEHISILLIQPASFEKFPILLINFEITMQNPYAQKRDGSLEKQKKELVKNLTFVAWMPSFGLTSNGSSWYGLLMYFSGPLYLFPLCSNPKVLLMINLNKLF